MAPYDCIIIDDDAYAIDGLKKYIDLLPNVRVLRCFNDPVEALHELQTAEPVDLLFMDINMPNLSGIELSKTLREKARKLIITTAYAQYGYDAYEVNADAYLLKPYGFAKFAATVTRLLPAESQIAYDYFFVKDKNQQQRLVRVYLKDIIAVESKQNYVMIYGSSLNVVTYMSLTEIAGILDKFRGFAKYHRSFIINCEHICSIAGNTVKMTNGLQITIGEGFRGKFSKYLDDKTLKASRRK